MLGSNLKNLCFPVLVSGLIITYVVHLNTFPVPQLDSFYGMESRELKF